MPTNIIDITNFVELTNTLITYLTNETIHNITQLDKVWYIDFTFLGTSATIFSAIIMMCTAIIMCYSNKLSAQSVQEMKKQREQIQKQYNDDIYQKDTKIYKEYVFKITKDWNKFNETYSENDLANSIIILLNNLATYIRQCLFELSFRSVYRKELQELLGETESYIDNFERTDPQKIIDFVLKIVNIFAKIEDYIIKSES